MGPRPRRTVSALLLALLALPALAVEKATIVYNPPPGGDDERPVITRIIVGPQGTEYAFKLEFNKTPWGEGCKSRCANATIFVDTDNLKATGLKLKDPEAAETGSDLAVVVQGVREFQEERTVYSLKVKVKQFTEETTSEAAANVVEELSLSDDSEKVLAQDTSVYLLVDANLGANMPAGPKIRVVYHPLGSPPLVGLANGLSSGPKGGGGRVEVLKQGKMVNPPPKKKKKE